MTKLLIFNTFKPSQMLLYFAALTIYWCLQIANTQLISIKLT